jgi:hypothetical protein
VEIVEGLLAALAQDNTYLLLHPTIRVIDLARFVPSEHLPRLRASVESPDDVEAANAALLLAACGDRPMATRLLDLALDHSKPPLVRTSALAAYANVGEPGSVGRLLDIDDWDGATALSRTDAAAGLMDASNARLVLAALARTNATVSSAYYRFGELSVPADIEAVLDALTALPAAALGYNRLSYYLDPFWSAVVGAWQPGWADKVARVVLRFEELRQPDDPDLERALIPALRSLPDSGHSIGRSILERLLGSGRDVEHLHHVIPGLIGPDDALWLAAQPGSEALVRTVRAFGMPPTSNALRTPIAPEQQQELDEWRLRDATRGARSQGLERDIAESTDATALFSALEQLAPSRWPEVTPGRRDWLARYVDEQLSQLDLRTRIQWRTDTELTQPRTLGPLLALVRRYELRLSDDEPLGLALLSESHTTRAYHKRFGLSATAIAAIESLLDAQNTPNPGLDHILSFASDARLHSPGVSAALERLAADTQRPRRIREGAVRLIADAGDTAALLRLSPSLPSEVGLEVDDLLVKAQHRGTIERRLQQLLDSPDALASGEVDRHFDNPLNWVGSIREPSVWTSLVHLRRLALERGLHRVTQLLTNTLAGIDMTRAAAEIDRQVANAPEEWRPYQKRLALEMTRDASIRAAQGVAFERVLQRLSHATTLSRFKIWAEGPTDCPAIEELASKIPGAETLDIVAQQLGGWNNILNPHWSASSLGDGCRDFAILLDGDRAYDYSRPGLVEKADARTFLNGLRRDGIEVRVLDRYGLENYFPQHAFEAVLGRDLSSSFPLDPRRKVNQQVPGHSKSSNATLAERTTLDDLSGTDLRDFLELVVRRASN